jgi:hypothetical protein
MGHLKEELQRIALAATFGDRKQRAEIGQIAEDALRLKCKHEWEGLPRLDTSSPNYRYVFADWCRQCGAMRLTRRSENDKIYQQIKLPEREK